MIILGIIVFIFFLYGSMFLAGFSGWLAARATTGELWYPLTFVYSCLLQTAYIWGTYLFRRCWSIESGEEPLLTRYLAGISHEAYDVFSLGAMFGVIGWIWCIRQSSVFLTHADPTTSANSA